MCRTVKTSIPSVLNYSRVPGASGIPHILRLHQTKPKGELKNKSKMVIWHEVDLEITPSFCGGFFVWFFFLLDSVSFSTGQTDSGSSMA